MLSLLDRVSFVSSSAAPVLGRYFFVFQFVLDVGPKLEPSTVPKISSKLGRCDDGARCQAERYGNLSSMSFPQIGHWSKSAHDPWFWLELANIFQASNMDQAGCDDIPAVLAAGSIHPFVGSSRGTGNAKHICNEGISTLQHGGLRTRT